LFNNYSIRADEIRKMMGRYGEVRDVYIPQDYHTKRPRGFAFVEFYNAGDAREALERLDGYELDGRDIAVVFAKDKRKTPEEMRGTGRGRGRDRDRYGSMP
jgi:RNA recognition motif-containing protein